jgi:hypothetical protein
MIRNFKALGLALVAILAMGAVVAGSASAAGERFHSEKTATILTGVNEGIHVFGLPNNSFKVECSVGEFKGTSLGEGGTTTNKTTTLHPTYSGCNSSLGAATVDTAGCNYVFGSETTAAKHLPVEIECTAGSTIKVTAPGCTLSFGSQVNGGGVSVANLGEKNLRDTTTVSTTTATFTKSGFGCFAVEGTSGTYSGATTLKGYEDKGVTGNIDEGATYTEGSQVGTWWE